MWERRLGGGAIGGGLGVTLGAIPEAMGGGLDLGGGGGGGNFGFLGGGPPGTFGGGGGGGIIEYKEN